MPRGHNRLTAPRRRRRHLALVGVAALPLLGLLSSCSTTRSSLSRPIDPVVVTGAKVPGLLGAAPSSVVGFKWDDVGGWQQVPVQVDERRAVDLGAVYHGAASGVVVSAYVDATTWTGADPDASFDADDELAFMARDAGGLPTTFSEPPGVIAGSGTDLTVGDPTPSGGVGHLYLFRSTTLSPAAGRPAIGYSFNLASGDYKSTYRFQDGPNPESSTVSTPAYTRHFSDRWLEDELRVTTTGATGVDLLDRHKALFAPGYCGRSEDTFDDAEGAFVANRTGPVRAIRSYIGANSGPNTQRTHLFYDQREDIVTDLRVHAIPSVMDFMDLSPAAVGATYANNLNPSGVTVDGVPDTVATGALSWEKVDGPQGAVVTGFALDTDTGVGQSSWYEDDATSPTTQCTGDGAAIGAAGPYLNTNIACTDPGNGCAAHLRSTRSISYLPPGVTPAAAASRATQATTPLTVTVAPWTSG